MVNCGDAFRGLPVTVQREVRRLEAVCEVGTADDYPTRCQQQRDRENARDALAMAVQESIDVNDAALDEARGRIEALERQAEIAADTIAKQRAEIALLRRHVADPSLAERADDRAIELYREATRIRRNMTERPYYADVRAARYSRAADRCEAIARHEPAFGGV